MNAAFRKGQTFISPEGVPLRYLGATGPNTFQFERLDGNKFSREETLVTNTVSETPVNDPTDLIVGAKYRALPGSVFFLRYH